MRQPRRERGLVANAGDPEQVRSAEDEEALRLLNQQIDLRVVASTRNGRRFLWRMLSECGLYQQSWVEGRADTTAFNEGQRARGLRLFAEWHAADPDTYLLAARESAEDHAADQAVREAQAIDRSQQDDPADG